jgi:hypothetical protein
MVALLILEDTTIGQSTSAIDRESITKCDLPTHVDPIFLTKMIIKATAACGGGTLA